MKLANPSDLTRVIAEVQREYAEVMLTKAPRMFEAMGISREEYRVLLRMGIIPRILPFLYSGYGKGPKSMPELDSRSRREAPLSKTKTQGHRKLLIEVMKNKGPMKVSEILRKMTQSGWDTRVKDRRAYLNYLLCMNKELFAREGRGVYRVKSLPSG